MRNNSKLKVIGELACDCGRVAYVEQTNRKGGFIQVRCGSCGVDQRIGKALQEKWRTTMQPIGHYHNSNSVAPFNADEVFIVSDTIPDTISDSVSDTIAYSVPPPVEIQENPKPVRVAAVKPVKKPSRITPFMGFSVFVISVGSAAILSELSKSVR